MQYLFKWWNPKFNKYAFKNIWFQSLTHAQDYAKWVNMNHTINVELVLGL